MIKEDLEEVTFEQRERQENTGRKGLQTEGAPGARASGEKVSDTSKDQPGGQPGQGPESEEGVMGEG